MRGMKKSPQLQQYMEVFGKRLPYMVARYLMNHVYGGCEPLVKLEDLYVAKELIEKAIHMLEKR
jgi:hypothetical protein